MPYLLGRLLEQYCDDRRAGRLKNRWEDELSGWAADMLEVGFDSPALVEAAGGINWERVHTVFEAVLAELGIASDPSAIDDDFIDEIFVEEYKRGYIAEGCGLLSRRNHLRERLNFPYHLHHGKYYTSDTARFKLGWHTVEKQTPGHLPSVMCAGELEKFTDDFLKRAGISKL